jgi:hypothetical protein
MGDGPFRLSPRGTRAALVTYNGTDATKTIAVADVSDLRTGNVSLTPLGPPPGWDVRIAQWVRDGELLVAAAVPATGSDVGQAALLRCRTDGSPCERVPLPAKYVQFDAVVPKHGP